MNGTNELIKDLRNCAEWGKVEFSVSDLLNEVASLIEQQQKKLTSKKRPLWANVC